jgi:MFS family permease
MGEQALSDRPGSGDGDGREPSAEPRSAPRLLVDRTFGAYFAGRLFWATGVWVYSIAAAIVVFELTRSTLLVGMVSVAHFLPQILLSPWSGAQADRGDRRKQIVVGRVISGVASTSLVLWISTIGLEGRTGATAVIVAALLTGLGDAYGAPAAHALLPAMVRPVELPAVVALDSIPFTAARAAGPALGALLVVSLGPAFAFSFSAISSFTFAIVVATLPIRDRGRPVGKDRSVMAGLRYIGSEPILVALLLGVAAIGIGVDPVITLAPAIADGLGGGSELVGVLASAFGIGAGATFLVLGLVRRYLGVARQGTVGLSVIAVGMLLLAGSPNPPTAVASLTLAGVGYTLALTALTTGIQQQADESMRGRVMALWAVAFLGSRPLAAALNGSLADAMSTSFALIVVAALVLLGAVLVRPSRTQP